MSIMDLAEARFLPVTFPSETYSLTYTGCNRAKTVELEDVFVRARAAVASSTCRHGRMTLFPMP